MDETWKDIPGYEGYYQASSLGKIRSLDRVSTHWKGITQIKKGKEISISADIKGYLKISLMKSGTRKSFKAHRLIAITFLDNKDNLSDVNHKNLNKADNSVSNLEWCSHKENCEHASLNGRKGGGMGSKNHFSKLTETDVLEIRDLFKIGKETRKSLAEKYSVDYTLIWQIVARKAWKHI
jgi:hypothetical protein